MTLRMAPRREVDFLVVTALPEEAAAVRQLLSDVRPEAGALVGTVQRQGGTSRYVVALVQSSAMGTNPAQSVAREALGRHNPKHVILTGIAAGFPEDNVKYGDVIVPGLIAYYELAKVRDRSWSKAPQLLGKMISGLSKRLRIQPEFEHRGYPVPVSWVLLQAASTISNDSTWADGIVATRPDGATGPPTVFCGERFILGCGEKVVASQTAEAREWLRKEYKGQAIGLEMEAYGVYWTCRSTDTPFLVVKACQDPATGAKDAAGQKDAWRLYSAEAAARFTVALIARFELPQTSLFVSHMASLPRVVESLTVRRPEAELRFTYSVSLAHSFSSLRNGTFYRIHAPIAVLQPGEGAPALALHGGGGTGKTTILTTLFERAVDDGNCALFVDLKLYSQMKMSEGELTPAEMLAYGSSPKRTLGELTELARHAELYVFLDGLNEIPREGRTKLVAALLELNREGRCYILAAERLGSSELPSVFERALVDDLEEDQVRQLFDRRFGDTTFDQLPPQLKEIYRRPFFLEFALSKGSNFATQTAISSIFQDFFTTQLRLSDVELDRLAVALVDAYDDQGRYHPEQFLQRIGQLAVTLVEAGALHSRGGFIHDLWRDYLAARFVARTPQRHGDALFDLVTVFASSSEPLSLAVEQIPQQPQRDELVKSVYDWNYTVALDCALAFGVAGGVGELSEAVRTAVIGAIADKRFDPVARTRSRAGELLSKDRHGFAARCLEVATRVELVQLVQGVRPDVPWFISWMDLFTASPDAVLTDVQLDLVSSQDSMVGWAAANAVRRCVVAGDGVPKLRAEYIRRRGQADGRSVRWRIVHCIGAYPDPLNVGFLIDAIENDEYMWVRYGASRALVEVAARGNDAVRHAALEGLRGFVATFSTPSLWMHRQIASEILEASFFDGAEGNWKDVITPILEMTVQGVDSVYRPILVRRLAQFAAG
jgi:nucleoside phosphorylase